MDDLYRPCTNDDQCDKFDVCTSSKCVTKTLIDDFRWQDIVGSLLVFIAAMLAAGTLDVFNIDVPGVRCCMRWNLRFSVEYRLEVQVGFDNVCGVVVAGGGLGGGGIFIPLYVLVIGMQTKQAVPVSQATIFGGSIVNMIFNVPQSHPLRSNHPLIDYMAIVMFTPSLLAGTTIGVVLNIIFPSWLITATLVVTLVYASIRTTRKVSTPSESSIVWFL